MMTGIQCVECGRFLGMADFALGLCDYTPDSEFTHERIEWTCRRHAQGMSAFGQDRETGLEAKPASPVGEADAPYESAAQPTDGGEEG